MKKIISILDLKKNDQSSIRFNHNVREILKDKGYTLQEFFDYAAEIILDDLFEKKLVKSIELKNKKVV